MWRYGIVGGLFACILLTPVPAGLTPAAWKLFATYIALISGIILRPQPEPVVMLVIIAIGSFFVPLGTLLSGFANSTAWLLFTAFLISQAFIETGLGRRLAYYIIGKVGHSALGLSYGIAASDLLLSTATPSNVARTGGVVYPIFRSVSETLGSTSEASPLRIGAFLTLAAYQISLLTSSMFITACSPNILIVNFAKNLFNVEITWMSWMWAALAPGLAALFLAPLLIYVLYPPELKKIPDAKEMSQKGLDQCGPMRREEKILIGLFALAILGWATGDYTKIDTTVVALLFLAGCFFFRLFSWDAVVSNKSAWGTFVWYGGMIGISAALAQAGFFKWTAKVIESNVNLAGYNSYLVLGILLFVNIGLRYVFASMGAYVVSIMPVLLILGQVAGAPLMPMLFIIAFSSSTGGVLTHYGSALGPVLFGTGYVDQKPWWKCGAACGILLIVIYMTIGLAYWKLLGY